MTADKIFLVSETEDGPTMPFEAWAALAKVRMLNEISRLLDEQGVPQDHAMRAKAYREVGEIVDRVCAGDLAALEAKYSADDTKH